jgi:1-acyl-sn-glycerol-3-phosphate acyltransferase
MRPLWCGWIGSRRVLTDQLYHIAVACEEGRPIYPVAISGSYEMSPVLWESTRLVRWSGLVTIFRKDEYWPSVPITVNHFVNLAIFAMSPWSGSPLAWGIFALLNVYAEPLYSYPLFPFSLHIRVGAPIVAPKLDSAVPLHRRTEILQRIHREVETQLAEMLLALENERPWKRLVLRIMATCSKLQTVRES